MSPIVAKIRHDIEGELEFSENTIESFMVTFGIDYDTYLDQKDGSDTATGGSLINQLTEMLEEHSKLEEKMRFFEHFVVNDPTYNEAA